MTYKEIFSKMKIVFISHEFSDKYISPNKVDKKLGLKFDSKNIFESAVKNSDLTYVFKDSLDNINKSSSAKKILSNSNHKVIDYSSELDPEERIELYNQILQDLREI